MSVFDDLPVTGKASGFTPGVDPPGARFTNLEPTEAAARERPSLFGDLPITPPAEDDEALSREPIDYVKDPFKRFVGTGISMVGSILDLLAPDPIPGETSIPHRLAGRATDFGVGLAGAAEQVGRREFPPHLGGPVARRIEKLGEGIDEYESTRAAERVLDDLVRSAQGRPSLEEERLESPINRAADAMQDFGEYIRDERTSPYQQDVAERMGEAVQGGILETLKFAAGNPLDFAMTVGPDTAAYLGPAAVGGKATRAIGGSPRAAGTAGISSVGVAATAQNAAEVANSILDMDADEIAQVEDYAALREEGLSDELARTELAERAFTRTLTAAGVSNTITFGLAAKWRANVLEDLVAGRRPSVGRGVLRGAAVGAGKETAFETLQEGGEAAAAGIGEVGADIRDLGEMFANVPGAATVGGLAGGPPGAAVGGAVGGAGVRARKQADEGKRRLSRSVQEALGTGPDAAPQGAPVAPRVDMPVEHTGDRIPAAELFEAAQARVNELEATVARSEEDEAEFEFLRANLDDAEALARAADAELERTLADDLVPEGSVQPKTDSVEATDVVSPEIEATPTQEPPVATRPEVAPRTTAPIAPLGDRWTADRGAMPGEPFAFLDGDKDTATAAITEVEVEGRDGVVYEATTTDGDLIGRFQTPEEAARATEERTGRPSREPARSESLQRSTVTTPAGRTVETEFEVVEAADLRQAQGNLQPRNRRDRAALDQQVEEIAENLNPAMLVESAEADRGAPIVGPDRVIESGNGRVSALERAYTEHPDRAQAYREELERRGFDLSGFERPVLVRRRTTELSPEERRKFVVEGNQPTTAAMSSTEVAGSDARAMTPELLAAYQGGDVTSASNRRFVAQFLESIPVGERARLQDRDGNLSQDGVRRIQNAMLARAYGDAAIIEKLTESLDNNIRGIGGALLDVAGAWAELRQAIEDGRVRPEFDVTEQIVEAARRVSQLRAEGRSPREFLDQIGMFEQVDPVVADFIRAFYNEGMTRAAGRATIANALRGYIAGARNATTDEGLFDYSEVTPENVLRRAIDERDKPQDFGDLFAADRPRGRKEAPRQAELDLRQYQDGVARDATYATRTRVVEAGTVNIGTRTVSSPEELARATSSIGDRAVEFLRAIVTDEAGNVLGVVGNFKGTVDGASVHPRTIAGEVFGIEGARKIWLSHNHPSGESQLSMADERLSDRLHRMFIGTDLEVMGIMAVGGGRMGDSVSWSFQYASDKRPTGGKVTIEKPTEQYPVLERAYTEVGVLVNEPVTIDNAKRIIPGLAAETPGIVFMDNRGRPVAFVPWEPSRAGKLRDTGALDELYQVAALSNAKSAIIANPDGAYERRDARNLMAALGQGAMEVEPRDIISYDTSKPDAPVRSIIMDEGMDAAAVHYFSEGGGTEAGTTVGAIQGAIDEALKGASNAPSVTVWENVRNADEAVQRMVPESRRGRIEGFYDSDSNAVHLFADTISSPDRGLWVTYHEIAGHHGLREAGKRVGANEISAAIDRAGQNSAVRALADRIARQRRITDRAVAIEEALAELAAAVRTGNYKHLQERYGFTVPAGQRRTLRGAIARLVEKIRAALRKLLKQDTGFGDREVYHLIEDAWSEVREGVRRPSTMNAEDIPRWGGPLPADLRAAETRLAEWIAEDVDRAIEAYARLPDAEGGKVLSVDTGRDLSADYRRDPNRMSLATHEPLSWLVKEMYARQLAEAPAPDESPLVFVTAGGTGAGKSSGIRGVTALNDLKDTAQVVYDTNMQNYESSRGKIEQARAAGKDVYVVLTLRDPIESLVKGALPRAMKKEGPSAGRTVPLKSHVDTHIGATETVKRLAEEYAGDDRVNIIVLDNRHGKGNQRVGTLENINEVDYTNLMARTRAALEEEYNNGNISEAVYRGFLVEDGPEGGARGVQDDAAGRAGARQKAGIRESSGVRGTTPGRGRVGEPGQRGETVVSQEDQRAELQRFIRGSAIQNRVYHGTDESGITAFSNEVGPIWFAEDPDLASRYADKGIPTDDISPNVIPAYLAIKNPLRIDEHREFGEAMDLSDDWGVQDALDGINENIQGEPITADEIGMDGGERVTLFEVVHSPAFAAAVERRGYDGIHATESGDVTWGALRPEQIKSAVGNRGTFDSSSPDIRMSEATPAVGPRRFRPPQKSLELAPEDGRFPTLYDGHPAMTGRTLEDLLNVFSEGASEKLMRKRGFEVLGKRIRDSIDREAELSGMVAKIMQPALKKAFGAKATVKGLFTDPVNQLKRFNGTSKVEREFESWVQTWARSEVEGQVIYDGASAEARALIDAWKELADMTGSMNRKAGVQVWDPRLRKFRGIGKIRRFYPRRLKPKYERAIRDPDRYREDFQDFVSMLIREGHIETVDEAIEYARSVEGRAAEVTGDFFAGMELARTEGYPAAAYDNRLNVGLEYLVKWAERLAQIEHLGQKNVVGHDGRPVGDVFDQMLKRIARGDAKTREYLTILQKTIYRDHPGGTFPKVKGILNQLATGLLLGNPGTATLNLFGGLTLNNIEYGQDAARAYIDILNLRKAIKATETMRELGAIRADYLRLISDYEGLTPKWLQKATTWQMKIGGYTPTERVIRLHAFLATNHKLRRSLDLWAKRGFSTGKAKAEAVWFRRNGFDPYALLAERRKGGGKETDRFLRYGINLTQGSYRLDQVPLGTDTPVGRFFLKFQKFGTQLTRMFLKNHLNPFLRAIATPKGETFRGRDPMTGKMVEFSHPRAMTLWPMLRYFAMAALGGTAIMTARGLMFGYPISGPDWDELERALEDDDTAKAIALGMEIAFEGIFHAGGIGILTTPYNAIRDVADRRRTIDPTRPPGWNLVQRTVDLGLDTYDQGGITGRDLKMYADSVASIVRTTGRATRFGLGTFGVEWDAAQLEIFIREHNHARKMARRYSEVTGLSGHRRRSHGRFAPTKQTPVNREVVDAIRLGRPEEARAILTEYLDTLESEDEVRSAIISAKGTVRSQQPSVVTDSPSDAERREFLTWARGNLTDDGFKRIEAIDRAYRHSAQAAGLLSKDDPVSERRSDIRRARRSRELTDAQRQRLYRELGVR